MNNGTLGAAPGANGLRGGRRVVGFIRDAAVMINPSTLTPLGPRAYSSVNPSPGSLTNILTITGRGAVSAAALGHQSPSSQSLRARMTLDGTVLFDESTASTTAPGVGYMLVGALSGSQVTPQYLPFERELKIEFSSNYSPGGTAVILLILGEIHQ